ncbi:MAG: GNAT family N-acetyltransferase [Steroidobacteraceae bacterium]
MTVIETARLRLREFAAEDAAFMLRLLNEPSFLRYIGDRGVRGLDDAKRYIADGPVAGYARFGYGLMRVERKSDGATVGMCGVLKRDALPDPDIGFSFLPEHWSQGYALESARAVMRHAREVLGLGRIVAITTKDNEPSIRLLEKLGFRFERMIPMGDEELRLFASAP